MLPDKTFMLFNATKNWTLRFKDSWISREIGSNPSETPSGSPEVFIEASDPDSQPPREPGMYSLAVSLEPGIYGVSYSGNVRTPADPSINKDDEPLMYAVSCQLSKDNPLINAISCEFPTLEYDGPAAFSIDHVARSEVRLKYQMWILEQGLEGVPPYKVPKLSVSHIFCNEKGVVIRKLIFDHPDQLEVADELVRLNKDLLDMALEEAITVDEEQICNRLDEITSLEKKFDSATGFKKSTTLIGMAPNGIGLHPRRVDYIDLNFRLVPFFETGIYNLAIVQDLVFKIKPEALQSWRDKLKKSDEAKHATGRLREYIYSATRAVLTEGDTKKFCCHQIICEEGIKGLDKVLGNLHIGDLSKGELFKGYPKNEFFEQFVGAPKSRQSTLISRVRQAVLRSTFSHAEINPRTACYRPIKDKLTEIIKQTSERLRKELEEACST